MAPLRSLHFKHEDETRLIAPRPDGLFNLRKFCLLPGNILLDECYGMVDRETGLTIFNSAQIQEILGTKRGSCKEEAIQVTGKPGSIKIQVRTTHAVATLGFPRGRPSLGELKAKIETLWNGRFGREAYSLTCQDVELVGPDADKLPLWPSANTAPHYIVEVESARVKFNSVNNYRGLRMLNVPRLTHWHNDHTLTELQMSASLEGRIKEVTTFETIEDVVGNVANYLAMRFLVGDPYSTAWGRSGRRDLVNPVLAAAVTLMNDRNFVMKTKVTVKGASTYGNVDWVIAYRDYNVPIIEAQFDEEGKGMLLGQVCAGIAACRQAFTIARGVRANKTDAYLNEVPMWAILTDGQRYRFFKYVTTDDGAGGGSSARLDCSTDDMIADLHPCATSRHIITPIIGHIMYILQDVRTAYANSPISGTRPSPPHVFT